MDKKELAVVLCRILALYFILSSIYGVATALAFVVTPMLVPGYSLDGIEGTIGLTLRMMLPGIAQLLIGVVVWRKATWIGERVAR